MTETLEKAIRALIAKADTFVNVAPDYTDPSTCTEDPCPFCTAAVDLQLAILDAKEALDSE